MGSVGAGNECPAGPDVGPHGSSPYQQNALVMALALFLGLPSRSVGSHRFAVALDADRLASARNDEVRIGCDRPWGDLVAKTERGSPFGQVVAPNNFGR